MSELTEPLYYGIHPLVCPLLEQLNVGRYSVDIMNPGIEPFKDNSDHNYESPNIQSFQYFQYSLRVVTLFYLVICSLCLIYMWYILTKMTAKVNEINDYEMRRNREECDNDDESKIKVKEMSTPAPFPLTRNPESPAPLLFGKGDNHYKKSSRLSEMIIALLNEYMNDWYVKAMIGEEKIKKWHPYLLTNDIELFGYLMVRIMSSKITNFTNGKIEYISVILSSAIFHALLKGPKYVMEDINRLYAIRLPLNCVSIYNIKRIRTYEVKLLKIAYENHMNEVQRYSDMKMKEEYFENQMDMDKIRIYNEELKKLILVVLSEINWNTVLQDLSSIYTGHDEEENESDYCLSPRRESVDTEEEHRKSHL